MKNSTTIKIPKKYHPMISEVYNDSDGYWLYTAKGYYSWDMDCGTIHEWTQKDFLQMLKGLTSCAEAEYCYCGHNCLEGK